MTGAEGGASKGRLEPAPTPPTPAPDGPPPTNALVRYSSFALRLSPRPMRIVSLLPAATEWIAAFGAAGDLVGRSHECDHPPAVADRPVLTRATYAADGDSAAIDEAVRAKVQAGLSLYEVDVERLRTLAPDLIVTQAQCDVCAVSLRELEALLARDLGFAEGAAPEVLSMEPQTYKAVLDAALRLGRAAGRMDAAMRVVGAGERRLHRLRDRLGLARDTDPAGLPTVACIEWMEPLMLAGHWLPDLCAHAGLRALGPAPGDRSPTVTWDAIRAADPDVLAVMPCGFTLDQTRRDLGYLTARPGWADLAAVRAGRVALLDGNAYFNRPGPRLVRAAELLAHAAHDLPLDPPPAPWEGARLAAAHPA